MTNPQVRDEIARTIGFWLELGVSGFRVDTVPFLLETIGQAEAAQLPHPHDYLADLRAFLGRRSGEGVLLGEVNLPYPDTMAFFGAEHEELTMCFDFIGMQRMYLSLARGNAEALAEALRDRPDPPKDAHWATFVRNHDELTLDKLTETQPQEIFEAFGPDPDMQVYGRGLRRRLPAMLGGDHRARFIDNLKTVGIDVLVPAWYCDEIKSNPGPVDFTTIYRTLETYGQIFGTEDAARKTVADLRQRVTNVEQQFRTTSPRTAADIYVSPKQLYAYGGPSLNNTILKSLGLTNVFADSKERTAEISTEALLAHNTDVLVLNFGSSYGITNGAQAARILRGMPGLDRLAALRNQRFISLNYSYLNGGPLAIDGLEMLAKQLAELK